MAIAKGTVLGPYEILALIGTGGMGEVWRARDKRIGRDVAVKVLPQSFGAAEGQVRRFEQEARAAGALNHPGLVTIFDVGTVEGSPYIVMEMLEGETLRDALGDPAPRPLPLRKTIDYAIQISSALAVAHEKGIIHRDLKPENVFITSEGRVKILDFGLAKLSEDTRDVDDRSRTARHLTSTGMVVGTPGYMSPEQVRAKPLDARTDIFSLGAVLYEMLSGRRAFDSESAVETMNAVLNDDPPPLAVLAPKVPPALDAIVRHCMEKNPRERFQSARDLAFQLRMLPEFQNSVTDTLAPVSATKAKPRLPYRTAAVVALAMLALAGAEYAFLRFRGRAATPPRTFKQLTFTDGLEMFPTLSPDGKTFAFVSSESGNRDVYIQRVDGRTARNLTGDSPVDDSEPAFSPDGSQIAFRSERGGGGIFLMGVAGESVRRLSDFGHNPAWSPDGTRLVVATERIELSPRGREGNSELWLIDVRDGQKRPLVQARKGGRDFGADSDAVQPNWSPHGNRIAFWSLSDSLGHRDIWTIDPRAPLPKETAVRVTADAALDWNPIWSPDGKFLYFGSDRDGTMNLWRIAIDEESGKPSGSPQPMSLPALFSGHFAISQQGDIAYATIARSYRLLTFPFDAEKHNLGPPRTLLDGSLEMISYQLSPDRQSLAFTTGGAQEDVFVAKADGTRLRQLTNDPARDRAVTWSSDGKTLYFYSNRDGAYHVWSIQADGSGLTRISNEADLRQLHAGAFYSPQMSPDRSTVAVQTDRSPALLHLDRPAGQRAEALTMPAEGSAAGSFPKWSPDGTKLVAPINAGNDRWLGFGVYSLQTRQFEKLSDRGASPQWPAGGNRIVFFESDGIGLLDVVTRKTITIPFAPMPGLDLRDAGIPPRLSSDGTQLLVRQTQEQGDVWLLQLAKE